MAESLIGSSHVSPLSVDILFTEATARLDSIRTEELLSKTDSLVDANVETPRAGVAEDVLGIDGEAESGRLATKLIVREMDCPTSSKSIASASSVLLSLNFLASEVIDNMVSVGARSRCGVGGREGRDFGPLLSN